jgi:hypothetical protein
MLIHTQFLAMLVWLSDAITIHGNETPDKRKILWKNYLTTSAFSFILGFVRTKVQKLMLSQPPGSPLNLLLERSGELSSLPSRPLAVGEAATISKIAAIAADGPKTTVPFS